MPIYGSPYGSGGRAKRTGYTGETGGSNLSVGTLTPDEPSQKTGYDPLHGPGSIEFQPADPVGSLTEGAQSTDMFAEGIRGALFGSTLPDAKGQHGGIFGIGNIPIVGDLLRAGGDAIGGAAGAIVGTGVEAISRMPAPIPTQPMQSRLVKDAFDALPDSSPIKQEALAQMAADKGLLGTGILDGADKYRSDALAKWAQEQQVRDPSLGGGLFRPVTTLGDAFSNLFGVFTAGERVVQRTIAGMDKADGLDRLDAIMAVGSGRATFDGGDGLNAVEELVHHQVSTGVWNTDQALDFIVSQGQGYSHNEWVNIAGSILLDPSTVAGVGAGIMARLAKTGVAAAADAARAASKVDEFRATMAGLKGDDLIAAEKELERLNDIAVNTLAGALKEGVPSEFNRFSPVARAARSERVGRAVRRYGTFYESRLANTSAGRVAKATRTILDPLHLIGGRKPRAEAAIDVAARQVSEAVVNAYGHQNYANVLTSLGRIGGSEFVRQAEAALAVTGANDALRISGRNYRGSLWKQWEDILDTPLSDHVENIRAGVNREVMRQMEVEAISTMPRRWDPAAHAELSRRMATLFGGLDEAGWLDEFTKMSAEQKALLHRISYGETVRQLHQSIELAKTTGQTGLHADRMHQLILISRTTLTDAGAQGILKRIEQATTLDAKMAELEQAMELYPELRNFVRDSTSQTRTLESFTDMLKRRMDYLPAQIMDAEKPQMPQALRDFDAKMGEIYTLGFRPRDEFLMGLERNSKGVLHEVSDPWVHQVSEGIFGYSPVRELSYNLAGQPLLDQTVGRAARMLDSVESAGKTLMHGVTGQMVTAAAKSKFIAMARRDFEKHGMPESAAREVWQSLADMMEGKTGYASLRGFGADDLWSAAKGIIRPEWRDAGFDQRRLMRYILEAYEGDLRHVGMTQKFTGRAKVLANEVLGRNVVGEVAEHAWPLLKFRLNPFFAVQELVEPFILNAQRGVSMPWVARAEKMTESDQLALAVFRNMTEKNLVHMADNDISELAAKIGWGKELQRLADTPGTTTQKFITMLQDASNIKGAKQLGMLRTWAAGLGREYRAAYEIGDPGRWDDIKTTWQLRTGQRLSDDEVAVRIAAENMAANDVAVRRMYNDEGVFTGWDVDADNAITVGMEAAPQHIGELRRLDLDALSRRMGLFDRNGRDLLSASAIGEALQRGTIEWEDVARGLREMGASADFIARVDSAFRFSWNDWWERAQTVYGFTPAERRAAENMFARIAAHRGMTPVEYMSQVYSPQITGGTEGSVGSLGALVDVMRGGTLERVPDLAQLVGSEGASTVRDFYRQVGAVMAHHLDPSAKRRFLLTLIDYEDEWAPGPLRQQIELLSNDPDASMADIERAWAAGGADAWSERLMNYAQGTPGTGAHTVPADGDLADLAFIRQQADALAANRGRPRATTRAVFEDDEALGREVAAAYEDRAPLHHVVTEQDAARTVDLGEVARLAKRTNAMSGTLSGANPWSLRTYPRQMTNGIFEAMDTPEQRSWLARITDTRRLYRTIVDDMGIKVTTTSKPKPYATADALRRDLARKRLKVYAADNWHPLLADEEVFMEKAIMQVFGYGQEANALDSHDAVMRVAALYGRDSQSTYVADELGRLMWERHSQTVIPEVGDNIETIEQAESVFGRSMSKPIRMPKETPGLGFGTVKTEWATRRFGNGIRALTPDLQKQVLGWYADFRRYFPDMDFEAINVRELPDDIMGMVMEWDMTDVTLTLSPRYGLNTDPTARAAALAERSLTESNSTRAAMFGSSQATARPRKSALGTQFHISSNPQGDFYHEAGHVVDINLLRTSAQRRGVPKADGRYDGELDQFFDNFINSEGRQHLSEYSYNVGGGPDFALRDSDLFAELFDLTFNPDHFGREIHPELRAYVDEFRAILQREGVFSPEGRPFPVNPNAGKTVAEVNAASRTMRAEHRLGALPPDLADRLTAQFLGTGRYAESDPNMARMAAFFNMNLQELMTDVASGVNANIPDIFSRFSGVAPPPAAYDFTEARLWNGVVQSMVAKWQDAFRLQYFAQNRSMLQRSINHPMFGLYPASYMWGKVGPELVKFIASTPFGIETGAMANSLYHLQTSVAMQRQYDPEFDAKIEDLGHSAAMGFLGYMLPATPWSIPASFPAWARDLASQGLRNDAAAEAGEQVSDTNFITPLQKMVDPLNPMGKRIQWFGRAAEDVGNLLPWGGDEEPEKPKPLPAASPIPGDPRLTGSNVDLSRPTAGLALGDALAQEMRDLQALLGG